MISPYTNMHLNSNSPAIDCGINTGMDESKNPLSGTKDIDNQSRIENDTIHIGADEYKL